MALHKPWRFTSRSRAADGLCTGIRGALLQVLNLSLKGLVYHCPPTGCECLTVPQVYIPSMMGRGPQLSCFTGKNNNGPTTTVAQCCMLMGQVTNGQKAQSVCFESGISVKLCQTSCVEVFCPLFTEVTSYLQPLCRLNIMIKSALQMCSFIFICSSVTIITRWQWSLYFSCWMKEDILLVSSHMSTSAILWLDTKDLLWFLLLIYTWW